MVTDHPSGSENGDRDRDEDDSLATRVQRALEMVAIGHDVTFVRLMDLGGIDEISVAGGTAAVTVTLPIPSSDIRTVVEREVQEAALDVDGISAVDCQFKPSVADPDTHVDFIPEVKNIIAVASGKGGVGKSTIATNLAVALATTGVSVGLLDADVYGPNAPTMLGLGDRKPDATFEDRMIPQEAYGVKVMSMGFIVGEDDPVIWRGPIVDEFIKQLFGDVEWGALDYLIVDLPPGTGDTQLSLVQHLPVTGAVIVTTPQPVAIDDARRGLLGFERYGVPILGITENMSQFTCLDCGSNHDLFGSGGAEQLGEEFNVPVLGRVPIDPAIGLLDVSKHEQPDRPGISIPGLGRLQLPRTREERRYADSVDPIAIRADAGATRDAVELVATQVAAQINRVTNDTVITK